MNGKSGQSVNWLYSKFRTLSFIVEVGPEYFPTEEMLYPILEDLSNTDIEIVLIDNPEEPEDKKIRLLPYADESMIYSLASFRPEEYLNFKISITKNFLKALNAKKEKRVLYQLKKEIPNNFKVAVFLVNYNESYKVVFKALKLGLNVYRLKKDINVENKKIPIGSFLIFNNQKQNGDLKKIINEMTTSPIFFNESIKEHISKLEMPKIGLMETYFHDMDAGWTRFIFDTNFMLFFHYNRKP